MAEALLRVLLCEKLGCEIRNLGERGYQVLSAGVHAMYGRTASAETIQVLAEQGIELLDHSSQPLSRELLETADAVYVMTQSHQESILTEWPEFETRVALLSQSGIDVSDPIGMGIDEYRRCKTQIENGLQRIIEKFD